MSIPETIAGFIAFLVGAGSIFYFWLKKQKVKRSVSCLPTIGRITRSEVVEDYGSDATVYKAAIEYDYYVGSRLYHGDTICIGGELNTSFMKRAQNRCNKYPVGVEVVVYYDPKNPASAYLERRAEGQLLGYSFGTLFVIVGILIMTGTFSRLSIPIESRRTKTSDSFVGKMDDFSYSGARNNVVRLNAYGEGVRFEQFGGHFIWVNYEAPWCNQSIFQAQAIKNLEQSFGDEAIFLTVMTSETAGVSKPTTTPQTAMLWSQRFQLDPHRVLASDLWFMVVPQHILFSPTGQTLYRREGYHSEEQIRTILSCYIQDWNNWSKYGTKTDWMKLSD